MFRNFVLALMLLIAVVMDARADVCKYWRSQVDPQVDVDFEIDETNPKNVTAGIDCLLKLQGNKREGLFGGATRADISQILPAASVEICALYYASYLFTQDWTHARGVALVGKDGSLNSDESVRKAFVSYRIWFKRLKSVGLEKARKTSFDPLANSDVRWY